MHFSFEALSSFDQINLGSTFLQAVVTLSFAGVQMGVARHFDRPYTLDVQAALRDERNPNTIDWQRIAARYPGADGLFRFSGVGFSPDRTMAAVYVAHACTPLCGRGGLEFFRKQGNRWRPVQVAGVRTCGWVS